MARKNTKKVKSANNRTVTAQQLEKDFLQAPKIITAQLNKEITALKQLQTKLNADVTKLKSQIAKSKNRTFITTNTKKLRALTKQWQDTGTMLTTLTKKQSKLAALQKSIIAFEKDWNKKAKLQKTTKTTAKPKTKKTAKKTNNITPITTATRTEPTETTYENLNLGETSEATS